MPSNDEKVIAVIGATGRQGGAVVRALQAAGQFKVRALEGTYGAFLVTNFREEGTDELKQGKRADRHAHAPPDLRHDLMRFQP